jgi:hypothetical protein
LSRRIRIEHYHKALKAKKYAWTFSHPHNKPISIPGTGL